MDLKAIDALLANRAAAIEEAKKSGLSDELSQKIVNERVQKFCNINIGAVVRSIPATLGEINALCQAARGSQVSMVTTSKGDAIVLYESALSVTTEMLVDTLEKLDQ